MLWRWIFSGNIYLPLGHSAAGHSTIFPYCHIEACHFPFSTMSYRHSRFTVLPFSQCYNCYQFPIVTVFHFTIVADVAISPPFTIDTLVSVLSFLPLWRFLPSLPFLPPLPFLPSLPFSPFYSLTMAARSSDLPFYRIVAFPLP